jgi:predicted dehydrogenase
MQSDPALANIAVYESPEKLMAHGSLDAVILCTPHQQHAQQMLLAAQAGLHVFCEKPLCLTLDDAQKSIAQFKARNLVLGIGHERRFEPEIMAMRQLIADGGLGKILQIEANFSQDKFFALPKDNWRLSNTFAPVGPLTATGIHLVDLSIALLGPCESVWARLATLGSDFENGDTLAIMMGFPNGANAMISAVLATPFEGRFAVYGSHGWIEVRDRTHPENPTGWDITTVLRGKEPQKRFAAPHPTVLANLEAFAKAVRQVAPYPVSTQEMLANVAALEAIMKSVQSKGLQTVIAA